MKVSKQNARKINTGSTGGPRGGHRLQTFSWSPRNFSWYKILNILFTANTCELGRCTRNEHDTLDSYCTLTYTKHLSGFLCLLALNVSNNI